MINDNVNLLIYHFVWKVDHFMIMILIQFCCFHEPIRKYSKLSLNHVDDNSIPLYPSSPPLYTHYVAAKNSPWLLIQSTSWIVRSRCFFFMFQSFFLGWLAPYCSCHLTRPSPPSFCLFETHVKPPVLIIKKTW